MVGAVSVAEDDDARTMLATFLFYFVHWAVTRGALQQSLPTAAGFLSTWSIDYMRMSLACLLTFAISSAFLLPPVRRLLARGMPIDPDSVLDCTALVLVAYYVGYTFAQLTLLGGLDSLAEGTVSPSLLDLALGGLFMVAFALAGVGWGTRRRLSETLSRLKLQAMTYRQWGIAGGLTIAFLAFDYTVSLAWSKLDPGSYATVSRAMAGLFGDLVVPGKALVLALSAGVGEELLFRGALQPRLGIWFTSLAFALGHLQYGFSPALVEVFIISIVLAYLRQKANTTTCVVVHTAYNFLDLLLLPFFP